MKRPFALLLVPLVFAACDQLSERSEPSAEELEAASRRAAYQSPANSFYGLTETQIVAALGQPKQIVPGQTTMGGNYTTLIWDEDKTWFNLWEADGWTAKSGEYEGVAVQKPISK